MTLTQGTINEIKETIAFKEGRLVCDISDAEVFEYIRDIHQADEDGSVYYKKHRTEIFFRQPRSIGQIVTDLTGSQGDWLSFT